MRFCALLRPWTCLLALCTPVLSPLFAASSVDFNRDIRPILSDRCFRCHGPDAEHREADLRFDTEIGAKADLGGYHAIVPGKPKASELVTRITTSDPDDKMPPADSGKVLSKKEISLLTQWIQEGAPWSKHWAYVPPTRQPNPVIRETAWPLNWVDHFILARLEAEGLEPSPEADPVTLIRRVTFDLTGLPPTPAEVVDFLSDSRPDAYARLVERLLRSPAYGERMSIYWLDLVRYADTVGYHGDQDHSISPYRDWVINAFNDNLPLDQFTRAQLAGDLVPGAGIEGKIASGYNRLLQTSHEGGVQQKEYLAMYAADRVRNLSGVWMGATMGCCQCHDHKFDPYTMKDFYSMVAFFSDIDETEHFRKASNSLPTIRYPEIRVLTRHERERAAALQDLIASLEQKSKKGSRRKQGAVDSQLNAAKEELQALEKRRRPTMISSSIEPRPIRVLPRGNWLDDSGPIVDPAIPEFMGTLSKAKGRATRLDLANWLVDTRNGAGSLTARVFANRFWYLLFGRGLAGILDDFGGQGETPSHPELLDALATELVHNGWDVKQMMRLLATSRTYRQASLGSDRDRSLDPYNALFARQSRYRLPAETVRDSALAISGLLVPELGGPSVKPYQPAGYYRHLNFPKRTYKAHEDLRQWRRGLYIHWQRQFLHPMLKAMDAPSREECTAQRPRSNTPLAALTLLNDPTFVEAARAFAQRILREAGSSTTMKLDFAFRHAVSRPPDATETKQLSQLLQSSRAEFTTDTDAAEKLLHTGLTPVDPKLDKTELAAWTMVSRAILNLNETITRN